MARKIEWRRRPQVDPHTGSADASGLPNRPFVYLHPQDQAASTEGLLAKVEVGLAFTVSDGTASFDCTNKVRVRT